MGQVYVLSLILFVTMIVGCTAADITDNVVIVNDINAYQKMHPDVELISLNETTKAAGNLTHTLGERTIYDRIIATGSRQESYSMLHNIQATLKYPILSAYGEKITCAVINVLQTSTRGKAFVTSGGLGKRHITIVVEAYDTLKFDYTATFYSAAPLLQSADLLLSLVSTILIF